MNDDSHSHSHHEHSHHRHDHGTIDPVLLTTDRGIWAVKWSLVGLAATAVFQLIIVFYSGSIALLADTIHNIADAGTAIPLWIAFSLCAAKAFPSIHLRLRSRRRRGWGHDRHDHLI